MARGSAVRCPLLGPTSDLEIEIVADLQFVICLLPVPHMQNGYQVCMHLVIENVVATTNRLMFGANGNFVAPTKGNFVSKTLASRKRRDKAGHALVLCFRR